MGYYEWSLVYGFSQIWSIGSFVLFERRIRDCIEGVIWLRVGGWDCLSYVLELSCFQFDWCYCLVVM